MRRILATALLAQPCCGLVEDSLGLVQSTIRRAHGAEGQQHPWATKNGNQNHTGFSAAVVPFDLSKPTWTYSMPVPNHNTPVIDRDGNVYITHTKIGVIALDRSGRERWIFKTTGENTGNPLLMDDEMYICSGDGKARALNLATGKQRWESRIAHDCPSDAWVATGANQTVIMSANVDGPSLKNCDLVAVSTVDGSVRWSFSLCKQLGIGQYNIMPSVVDGGVIFQDSAGGIHRVSLATGKLEWTSPSEKNDSFSTGGMVTGPNDVVYGASNYQGYADKGKGILRALDLRSGKVVWERKFDAGLNAGPAVGRLGPSGRLAVVANVADNFLEWGLPASVVLPTIAGLKAPVHKGAVMAVDAATGETIWSYQVDEFQSWQYPLQSGGCLPDAFANPAIGGDGTVYINWSGGYAYAIRDADGDGTIAPSEVSKVRTDSGMNGESALAPGLLVIPSCDALRAYVS